MCLALKRLNIIIAQAILYELDNIHQYVFLLNSRALVWIGFGQTMLWMSKMSSRIKCHHD